MWISFWLVACVFFMNGIHLIRLESDHQTVTWRPMASEDLLAIHYTNLSFSHAESPVWDERTETLYWVDVLNQDVYALDYRSHMLRAKHIAYGEVNLVVPIENSSRVLLGVRSEVFLLDWERPGDAALRLVAALDLGKPDNILNEGKADAIGRFWGGTKGRHVGEDVVSDEATLYSLEQPTFEPKVQLRAVSISNGMVWALNNSVHYYIDSPTKKIEAFDFDLALGQIRNRRTIVDTSEYRFEAEAIPDGMTIDRDGQLWVAMMFDGSIIHIDPDSRAIVERFRLPVKRITSLTWAGVRLEDLIVTTSRRNMSPAELEAEPLSGKLFALHNLQTGGVVSNKVVFPQADRY